MTAAACARPTLLLWGFMGTGKTTVGALVASRCGARFVDLDEVVEACEGASIEALFSQRGEPAFRRAERRALFEVLDAADGATVVALGGGALLDDDSRARAHEQAYVVTLTASATVIAARTAGSDRPLLRGDHPARAIAQLLDERRAAYQQTHHAVLTDQRTPEQVADDLLTSWRPAPPERT